MSLKRYRYTGKERDEETALYYHGARYYAPWLGRWTAPDPLGLRDGPNPYGYVRCNPVRLVDPTGTQCDDTIQTCRAQTSQSVEMTDQASSVTGHLADQPQDNPAAQVALAEGNFGGAQPPVDMAKIVNDVKAQAAGQPSVYVKQAIYAQNLAQEQSEEEAYKFQEHEREVANDMPTGIEGVTPVLGMAESGIVRYKHKDYILGTADMLLAVSDALMVKALVVSGAKLAISGSARLLAAAAAEETATIGLTRPIRLPIVNPHFTPTKSAADVFQGFTENVAGRLQANPRLFSKYLSPSEQRFVSRGLWAERIKFGNAVERAMAETSEPSGLLIHTGEIRPYNLGGADFVGARGTAFEGLEFQVTSENGFGSHFANSPEGTIFGIYPKYPVLYPSCP